jgi:hypothetical protein
MSRHTMWFLLPNNINALVSNTGADRTPVQFYLNPQSIDIKENKLVNHTLAKGGYIVQYWGEELPVMSVNGTTGSGGIEAIEVLRDVYRHEQHAMERILLRRAQNFAANATETLEDTSSATAQAGLVTAVDRLFNDAATNIIEGTKSAIEEITEAWTGISDDTNKKVGLIPSLGAFAVSIEIFFQGVKYRGFFKDFGFQENAQSPGLFDYSFTFMITKRTGRRKNFMPWHRRATALNGQPLTASIPIAGAATNELSFPTNAEYGDTQSQIAGGRKTSSFNETQEGEKEPNSQGVNRRSKF